MTVQVLTGAEAVAQLGAIAALRIAVFRDWPYLYDGDAAYERAYLAPFAESPSAILIAAFDGARLVGAATGAAMEEHQDAFAAPLAQAGLDPLQTFYCAESVLLPRYRGHGLGHRFFDLREDHGRALGRSNSVFCAVIRPADHPARPQAPRDLAPFWTKRGYLPVQGAIARFSWRDLGETEESIKPLQLWSKSL